MKQIISIFREKRIDLILLFLLICILFIMVNIGCTKQSETDRTLDTKILIPDSLSWSCRMADSEIYRRGNSLDFGSSNPDAKWDYQTGLFLKALLDIWQKTGQSKYLEFSKRVMDSYLGPDGNIQTYRMSDYNIDNINTGKVLLILYSITKEEKYKKAAFLLKEQLDKQPRTKAGGFWHKKKYPWQMWLDGIYMGSPFYAEFSKIFDQPAGFEDVIQQILIIDVHTRDSKTGLRYHGWDESNNQKWANAETGCSPNFWGRAMGWYFMALVDVLDFIPLDYPKRDQVIFILNDISKSIANYQDESSGLWYQVLDQAGRKGNYLEASASSMFVYALAKAVRNGYIDPGYREIAEKGYKGLLENLIKVEPNGLVTLTQVCSVSGLGGEPYRDGSYEYYISEPVVANDLKGVGPFIMASLEMEQQAEK
jgi:unsaturated rhamnogalacturonyl hydrolase